jgi:hypothetical protein
MKTKRQYKWLIGFGILLLLGGLLFSGQLAYMLQRQNRLNVRPLVLITSPANAEQISSGAGVIIHATARSIRGISTMELWVDGQLYTSQAAGEEGAQSPFVLNETWQPSTPGSHLIQVRAVSSNGMEGQATITVAVSGTPETSVYTLQEGDDISEVAGQFGLTAEDLSTLDPEMDLSDLGPGDSISLPEGEAGAEDGSAPITEEATADAEESEPPAADAPEPGSFFELVTLMGVAEYFDPAAGSPAELRLEISSLVTPREYDSLHCYIGVAGTAPQWVPDVDLNQATDESFTLTDDGWNVADYYAGALAPQFAWPNDEALPFSLNCVGVLAGVEALPAGNLEISIPPEEWDGVSRTAAAGDGGLQIQYRIVFAGSVPQGIPIYLDAGMTAPTNLWLDDRRYALHWDYEPEPDELEVGGFRVYLNGNLQWSVRGSRTRQTDIPPQWFHPPCGDEYVLSVSAYRDGYPDGPESFTAMPPVSIVTPDDQCSKQIEISFVSLRTFELGGDSDGDESHGDVGSIYADFFANEQVFSIDSRSPERYGLDLTNGLSDGSLYDFNNLANNITWHATGNPYMVVDVEPNGTFQYGFTIMDHDWGPCRHSGDTGCDDLLCEGASFILYDHYGNLDTVQEQTLRSTNERCEVTVRFGPAPGSIVGSAGDGPALPFLSVENYHFDDETNAINYDIVNTGSGTWPTQPLEIWMTDREGNRLESLRLSDFRLDPGQSIPMEYISRFDPAEVCISLDPNNSVLERFEATGAISTTRRYCPPMPDLVIRSVEYDAELGHLVVIIQNIGSELIDRTISFAVPGIMTGSTVVTHSIHLTRLREYDSFPLRIPVTTEQRENLVNGYTLIVDSDHRITEEDEDNNEYTVSGRTRYWITWHTGCSSGYVVGLINDVHMRLEASIIGSAGEEELADWRAPELSGYSTFGRKCWGYDHPNEPTFYSDRFFLVGDEKLKVRLSNSVNAGAEHYGVGEIEFLIDPSDPYGNQAFVDAFAPTCDASSGDPGYYSLSYSYPGAGRRPDPGEWHTLLKICRLTGE